jgi:hypothetical protein
MLVAAGNQMGHGLHFMVGGVWHWTNLYCTVVGRTSRARKGTSQGPALAALRTFDHAWAAKVAGGLSTAEGLISAVRDPTYDGDGNVKDPGVPDKRLLVTETEFASVMKRMGQEGSTLSIVLRQAWDGEPLSTKTRHNPLHATDPHISGMFHVTEADLRVLLRSADIANGFGNRFLWVMAERAGVIPQDQGWTPLDAEYREHIAALRAGVAWGRGGLRLVEFDDEASPLWNAAYTAWAVEDAWTTGKGQEITARAEAQVRRLAMVYAGLDGAVAIGRAHLAAALEVWRYCDDSARYLFGDDPSDPDEAKVVRLLRTEVGALGGGWLSRAEINGRVKGKKKALADDVFGGLVGRGVIEARRELTAGRPRMLYRLTV